LEVNRIELPDLAKQNEAPALTTVEITRASGKQVLPPKISIANFALGEMVGAAVGDSVGVCVAIVGAAVIGDTWHTNGAISGHDVLQDVS